MSSTHGYLPPALKAARVPRTCSVLASTSFAFPFRSPTARNVPSEDQSSAVTSNSNNSEALSILVGSQILMRRSDPQVANFYSLGCVAQPHTSSNAGTPL